MAVLSLMALLGLGILSDISVTAYYIFVSRQKAIPASLVSILIALLNFFITYKVLIVTTSIIGCLAYALGNAIGCFIIISITKKLKK